MRFKINNRNWEIKELSQEEMKQHITDYKWDGQPGEGRYYGQTYFDEQTIYLDKDLHIEQKRQTLMHELGHCYIGVFITHQTEKYDEETVVNILSNSHDIIHEIVDRYFGKEKTFITVTDNTTGISGVTVANLSERELCIDNKTMI